MDKKTNVKSEDGLIRMGSSDMPPRSLLEEAKMEFLKVIFPEKVIAPEDMKDFTKIWFDDYVPDKFIRKVMERDKSEKLN